MVSPVTTMGVGGQVSQSAPPCCVDYCQLKTSKAQQTQEDFFTSPFLPKEIQLEKRASGREP